MLPSLAKILGLDEAIIIQQLWYWLNPKRKSGKVINGYRWIYNTYKEWQEQNFPFWSEIHIKRLFLRLEKSGIIISCQPEGGISRRKYYRLSDAFVIRAKKGDLGNEDGSYQIRPSYPVDTMVVSSGYVPICTETTGRDNLQRVNSEMTPLKNGEGDFSEFPSKWKPDMRSKEQKLASIDIGSNYPSEVEFDAFLEEIPNGCLIAEYRSDLYYQLCDNKWHEWREDLKKWIKVRNWKAYVEALADKIQDDSRTR